MRHIIELPFIIMNIHRYIRIKYYKIVINVAFSTFNNGDFKIQLLSNTMLIANTSVANTRKNRRTYNKIYRITHKLNSLKSIANTLLVLLVTRRESQRALKRSIL